MKTNHGHKLWTAEEDKILLDMRRARYPYCVIAAKLGRTERVCFSRTQYLGATDEQKKAKVQKRESRRRPNVKKNHCVVPAFAPPADVIADRNRRSLFVRSLTAALFGDPLPGYSALDRRA